MEEVEAMKPTAYTFFSGAGGACTGLSQAGFAIVGGNEYDEQIADIWRANHDAPLDTRSILDINPATLPNADLYWFSPPCQSHSIANPNRTTGTDSEDTAIAQQVAATISAKIPRCVVIENVPGYAKSKSFALILVALLSNGYSIEQDVLKACDYGNAQSRERLIVRASLDSGYPGTRLQPQPFSGWWPHLADLLPTMEPTDLSFGQDKKIWSMPDDIYLAQRTGCSKNGHQFKAAHEPSFTITASMGRDERDNFRSPATVIIKRGNLALAYKCGIRELARIQGFPDGYQWPGKPGIAAKAIGNAVPVSLAKSIGESFIN
jgi:DNA (cytosine-5)-methyltransferase 1